MGVGTGVVGGGVAATVAAATVAVAAVAAAAVEGAVAGAGIAAVGVVGAVEAVGGAVGKAVGGAVGEAVGGAVAGVVGRVAAVVVAVAGAVAWSGKPGVREGTGVAQLQRAREAHHVAGDAAMLAEVEVAAGIAGVECRIVGVFVVCAVGTEERAVAVVGRIPSWQQVRSCPP
jgi:hypothetical protein